ncbi:MAG: hypothetical protein F4Y78_04800 [Candidatus Dadabacteria bacterium]|nr:hypothetical protein [Candidatus Dadabacteria bacterium]MYA48057.1 hypothetical protein [Candidatus Dadabacteria bacterium]
MGCEFSLSDTSALIGGGLTILGVCIGLLGQHLFEKRRQQNIVRGFLETLYEEFNALWEQINGVAEKHWKEFEKEKKEGKKPILHLYLVSISKDDLAIYRSNANLIVQIKDSDLRRKIVEVYMSFQALIEGYKINNRLLDERIEVEGMLENEALLEQISSELHNRALDLERKHDDFRQSIEDLFKMLKKRI